MARKRVKAQGKIHVNVSLDADVAQRLSAYAGFHRRRVGDVVAEGVKIVMRGFSARQEGPRVAAGTDAAGDPGGAGEGGQAAGMS